MTLELCWNADHAPRGCGLVSTQTVMTESGATVVWRCTFCADERRAAGQRRRQDARQAVSSAPAPSGSRED